MAMSGLGLVGVVMCVLGLGYAWMWWVWPSLGVVCSGRGHGWA